MKASVLPAYLLALAVCFGQSFCSAQEAVTSVATISQVLPLAIAEKAAVEPTATSSGVATPNPANVTFVQAGASISTGQGGASSLILGTTGAARMKAETEVKIPDASEKSHSLELLKGQLFLNISGEDLKKRNAGEFKLKTPAALLAVKGTQFFAISSAGTDTIGVHHGTVVVTEPQSGQSVSVEAGHAVNVSPGLLSETRALSETEGKLSLEYDLANLTAVSVPSIVYQDKPQPQALLFREGKVVTTPQPEYKFHNMDAHLWWPYSYSRQGFLGGNLDLSPEGFVRYSWRVAAVDKGRRIKTGMVTTGLSVSLRGQSLEYFHNKPNQQALLKVAALRFRIRTTNVKIVWFQAQNVHTSAGASENNPKPMMLHDQKDASVNKYVNLYMPLLKLENRLDGVWQDVLLPVNKGSYGGIAQAFNNLFMQTTVQLEDSVSSLPNKQPSVLEMADFELLVIP